MTTAGIPAVGQDGWEWERMFESRARQLDEENSQELYQQITTQYEQPLDLNVATMSQLRNLGLLSEAQVDSILSYRRRLGPFVHALELQAVPGMDTSTIKAIIPFVRVRANQGTLGLWKRMVSAPNRYLLVRYGRALHPPLGYKGASKSRYPGTADRVLTKFRWSRPADFSLGLVIEKDPGETVSWNTSQRKYLFDFQSFHFLLENRRWLKRFIVGDFQLQIGQGLVTGGGFQLGKGRDPIASIRRNNLGLLPYSSATEFGFYRGIATNIALGKLQILGFLSRIRRDATIHTTGGKLYFSSLRTSGLHRTLSERTSARNLREMNLGGVIQFDDPNRMLNFGIQFSRMKFSLPQLSTNNLAGQPNIAKMDPVAVGAFGSYQWNNLNLFGEWAISGWRRWGGVLGLISSMGRTLDISLLLRSYQPGLVLPNGKAFGESRRNENESGIYWGILFKPFRGISLGAFFDYFRHAWLKNGIDAPSSGTESRITLHASRWKGTDIIIGWRAKLRDQNQLVTGNRIAIPQSAVRHYGLFQINLQPHHRISIKTRIQYSRRNFVTSRTYGFLLAQDINLDWRAFRLSTRLSIFDVEDHHNRQYIFEKNALYQVSFHSFQNSGVRNYLLVQWKIHQNVALWIKLGRTMYHNLAEIGSGLDQVEGNKKAELSAQVIWRI